MEFFIALSTPQILVPLTLSATFAYIALEDPASYLLKWSAWWAVWSVRYILGALIPGALWFQAWGLPASAILSSILAYWGARQARDLPLPLWWKVLTTVCVATWIPVQAALWPEALSPRTLAVPLGYMSFGLLMAGIEIVRWDVAASVRTERNAVALTLFLMALLQASFPIAAPSMPDLVVFFSQISTALQLMIALFAVTLHFGLLRSQAAQSHAKSEELLSRALDDFIPICMGCKSVRVEGDEWRSLDRYLADRAGSEISHGVCPDCVPKLFPTG